MQCFYTGKDPNSIPIYVLLRADCESWKLGQDEFVQNWLQAIDFKAVPNHPLSIPGPDGHLHSVLVIAEQENPIWALGNCPRLLPAGKYHIADTANAADPDSYLLGWGMGAYQYARYRKENRGVCRLSIDCARDHLQIEALLDAVTTVRDLVNTPTSDMSAQNLYEYVQSSMLDFDVELTECAGAKLLEENCPLIHAVGRASVHQPRLIEWKWGKEGHARVVLVGKGVTFDSGGLNIKTAQGMRLMKKDMGGAAHVIGIARAVMKLNLPVRLHVMVPAVENAISGDAYHPGDVLISRSGKTVEVEDTDAEGRLILCDAISKAVESSPDLVLDFATLTGAARVALGTEVPVFFTNDSTIAEKLTAAAHFVNDPVWQLPLHTPYRYLLNSDIADISNCSSSGFGGAITAALFLNEFVPDTTRWLHFDMMAWNTRDRSGRPKGGEAMGLRATIRFLQERYS